MANTAGSKHTTGTAKTQTPLKNSAGGSARTSGTKHTADKGGAHPPVHQLPLDRATNMSTPGSDNMGHHPNGEHCSDCGPVKQG